MANDRFNDLPVRHKLRIIVLSVMVGIVLVVFIHHSTDEYDSIYKASQDKMASIAAVLGRSSTAGILFNDAKEVDKELALAGAVPNIISVTVSRPDGSVFARYNIDKAGPQGGLFDEVYSIFQPILMEGEVVGGIGIKWELQDKYLELLGHKVLEVIVVFVITVLFILLLDRLINRIIAPITLLSRAAKEMGRGNLSGRIEVTSKDEVGELAASFNEMVEDLRNTTVSRDELSIEIEERKRVEEVIRKQETEWRNTFDSISDFVSIHDKDFHIIKVNKALADFLGMSPQEIAGKHCYELLHGTTEPWSTCPHMATLESGRSESREVNDPNIGRSLLVTTYPIFDENGILTGSVHIAKDITERKKAEEALRESETNIRELIEHSPIAMIVDEGIDVDEKILVMNIKFTELFGYTMEDVPDVSHWWPLAYPDEQYREKVKAEWIGKVEMAVKNRGEIDPMETTVICKDGSSRYIKLYMTSIGKRNLIAFEDLTERKRMEVERELLLKMTEATNKELNDFAYIVSHDLKAPLRGISQLSDWLTEDYMDVLDDAGREKLELLKKRALRMHVMIEGILKYSRAGRDKGEAEEVDTGAIVRQVIDSISPPQNIRVRVHGPMPHVVIDPLKLIQIFQNLISNAIKYMDKPEGSIEVGCVDKGELYEFFVKDNGPGIDEKHFDRIFQIFQTLTPKSEYESTGIGLTIVKKIVEQAGGRIWVESEVEKGSTFKFTLPKM